MLRKKTRNHGDASKRQSMFMETMVNSFSLHQDKPTNSNRPLDYISDPIPMESTTRVPVRLSRREYSLRSSETKVKALKRSSMMLDGNIIRDYNLAVKGMNDEQNTTRSNSESSITSNQSSISSLFSNGNSNNLRDLLYEELDTVQMANDNNSSKNDTLCVEPLQGTKALFMIKDNMRDNGSWLDPQEIGINVFSNETTPELNRSNNKKFSRTVLDFI